MRVVLQKDLTDCGICSLKAIINYYHGDIPLEVLRHDTFTDSGGTDAYHLLDAAKKYGFDGYGTKVMDIDEINSYTLPAIAHTIIKKSYEHFVVIESVTKNDVYLMDPAKGHVKMSRKEFITIWSNILIIIYPQTKILKYDNTKPLYKQLGEIVKNEKDLIIKLIFLTFILTTLTIGYSFFLKIVLNNLNSINQVVINNIMIIFGFMLLLRIIFNYYRNYYEIILNKNIDAYLKRKFIHNIFFLPSISIKSRSPGEILTRVNELENYKSLLSDILITIFLDSLLVIISAYFLYQISHILFLITLLMLLIYFLVAICSNKLVKRRIDDCMNSDVTFNNNLIENVNSLDSLKHLHVEKEVFRIHEKHLTNAIYGHFRLEYLGNVINVIKSLIHEYGLYIINVLAVLLIIKEKISIIDYVTFNSLLVYFKDPIKNYLDLIPKISYIKASLDKLNEFSRIEPEQFDYSQNRLKSGSIMLKNLSYAYNGINYCIKDFSTLIKEKSKVMIKGTSGSGKSTICKMIYQLITNYEGSIYLGEQNIKDYDLNIIRTNIGYLSQKENLFSDTIYNNLVLGRKIEQEKINKVMNITLLTNFINNMPLRYETNVFEQGKNLSGGEKQRLLLSRILLKEPQILILDEALSEVSEGMERKIIHNIKLNYPDMTLIYVSHRHLEKMFDDVIEVKKYDY